MFSRNIGPQGLGYKYKIVLANISDPSFYKISVFGGGSYSFKLLKSHQAIQVIACLPLFILLYPT